MNFLFVRPYYGINIHSDSQGELGSTVYDGNVNPDLSFIIAATIANQDRNININIFDAIAQKQFADDMLNEMVQNKMSYEYIFLRASAPTVKLDIKLAVRLKEIFPKARICFVGHVAKLLKSWLSSHISQIDEIIDIPLDFYLYKLLYKTDSIDINKFPCPDYRLFPVESYVDQNCLRLALQTSRGCNMGCQYCPYRAFYNDTILFYDVEKVIEDIKIIIKFNPDVLLFRDQFFTADKARIRLLCKRIIEEKINIHWTCETRLEFLDEDLLELMIQAGMSMICFGVESGNADILESYSRKKINYDILASKVNFLNQRGVLTLAFYIIGFPEETWETAEMTLKLALKIGSTIAQFSPYEPCVTDSKKELTPDDFCMYKNTMKNSENYNLNSEEISYLVDAFSTIYNFKHGDLKNNYYYEAKRKKEHLELIENLLPYGDDIDAVCQIAKKYISENENRVKR